MVDFNDSGITYNQLISVLKHMYSDYVKIDAKSIYDLLSVCILFSFIINPFFFCSSPTDTISNASSASVSTSLHNISRSTPFVRYSNMPITLTVQD